MNEKQDRINDKIEEIGDCLTELNEIMPKSFIEYKQIKTKAACERYFEKIIEAVTDLAFLIIKEKRLKIPEDDKGVFDILFNEKIISEILSEKLKDAKGMRNLLAHKYGSVDDEIAFNSISEEIIKDAGEFIEIIKKELKADNI